MALFYKYGFMYKGLVKWFYATDEEDARAKYLKHYGEKAGDLVERQRW